MIKMSSLFVDQAKADDGIWQSVGPFEVKIRFAAASNKAFQKKMEELTRPHRKAIELDALPADLSLELAQRCYAETVVVDWRGLADDAGNPLPYSVESCMSLFKGNPNIYKAVVSLAGDDAIFRRAVLEEQGKNS
jgi:hypothetical protein